MKTTEERLAHVEGRVGEHSLMIDGIRQAIVSLDHRLVALETRMDQRFGGIDQRFAGMESRLDHLTAEMSRQFRWTVGIQITTFALTIGAILTALFARL